MSIILSLYMGEEVLDFSDLSHKPRTSRVTDREKTCRIIASIFEIFESLVEERLGIHVSDGGDDSAHNVY